MNADVFLDTNVLLYAAIVTAAKQMGCHSLYSEDLNHGQVDVGVTVVNPFAASAAP